MSWLVNGNELSLLYASLLRVSAILPLAKHLISKSACLHWKFLLILKISKLVKLQTKDELFFNFLKLVITINSLYQHQHTGDRQNNNTAHSDSDTGLAA